MMCPGFMRSDTPMMATERGSSSRSSLAMGRARRRRGAGRLAAQLQQDVERDHAGRRSRRRTD